MALTGEVGTGKTLLIPCLLRMLKNSDDESPHGRVSATAERPRSLHYLPLSNSATKCADRQPGKKAFAVTEDSHIFARLFNCPSVESVADSSTVPVNMELD